jgi:hypothetical protein
MSTRKFSIEKYFYFSVAEDDHSDFQNRLERPEKKHRFPQESLGSRWK